MLRPIQAVTALTAHKGLYGHNASCNGLCGLLGPNGLCGPVGPARQVNGRPHVITSTTSNCTSSTGANCTTNISTITNDSISAITKNNTIDSVICPYGP